MVATFTVSSIILGSLSFTATGVVFGLAYYEGFLLLRKLNDSIENKIIPIHKFPYPQNGGQKQW